MPTVRHFEIPANNTSRAREFYGKIIAPKTAVPKMGYWAVVTDTERNPVGLWEDNPKAM